MQVNRILTTHTGSLIRPPEVLAFLDAFERGEEVDESKWTEAMSQSVATIVREQVDAGIDIVSDGEIGKVSWISYLYERLSGLEVRELPPGSIVMPPSRDRQMFPEFYAEEEKQFAHAIRRVVMLGAKGLRERRGLTPSGPEQWTCTGPIRYEGTALLQRDIDNLRAALRR